MTMNRDDVPQAWVDAAMVEGVQYSIPASAARILLASAYDTIREDLLWEVTEQDAYVTCACGRSWEVCTDGGPDWGHGRTECPASQDALITINGVEIRLSGWSLTPLASWGVGTGRRWQLGGWLPEKRRMGDSWSHPLYDEGARLEAVDLPGRMEHFPHPGDRKLDVEIQGVGGPRLWFAVRWDAYPG